MANGAMKQVNAGPNGSYVPQYSQTPVVSKGGATSAALSGISTLIKAGGEYFGAKAEADKAEEAANQKTAEEQFKTELNTGLTNIATKSDMSQADIFNAQKMYYMQLQSKNPDIDLSSTFKAATGQGVAELSEEQKTMQDIRGKLVGMGRINDNSTPEYVDEQIGLYQKTMSDSYNAKLKLEQIQLDEAEGKLSSRLATEKKVQEARVIVHNETDSINSQLAEVYKQYELAERTPEAQSKALLAIEGIKLELTKNISLYGSVTSKPEVKAMLDVISESISLQEKRVQGKMETDAYENATKANTTLYKHMLYSDPKIGPQLTVLKETGIPMFADLEADVTNLMANAMRDGRTTIDTSTLDSKGKQQLADFLQEATSAQTKEAKEVVVKNTVALVRELGAISGDVDTTNSRWVVGVLNKLDNINSLPEDSVDMLRETLTRNSTYIVGPAVREAVSEATLFVAKEGKSVLGTRPIAQYDIYGTTQGESKPATDFAEIVIDKDGAKWVPKDSTEVDMRLSRELGKLNQRINNDINPTLSLVAKAMNVSIEQAARFHFPASVFKQEEKVDESKKQNDGIDTNAGDDTNGGKGATATLNKDSGVASDMLAKHLIAREDRVGKVYKDSLGKPTAGIGHLLTAEERKKYPVGTEIPDETIDMWFKEDMEEAKSFASKQAKQVPNSSEDFVNALASVNFQIGADWINDFPTAWKMLKAGEWEKAIAEIEYTYEGSGKKSDWNKQTPKRVRDFVEAIRRLGGGNE